MKLLEIFNELSLHPKNAAELKGLILQLAVQGKLTAKWREENLDVEPASQGFVNKRISTFGYEVNSLDEPFNLPHSWQWCKFIDVAELRHGHQFRKHDFVDSGIPVIKIGQCKPDGTLDLSSCNYIDDTRLEEFKDVRIFKGHLLMALTGGTLGKVTRVKYDYGKIVQNYRVGNFFTNEKVLSLDFLNVILESDLFQRLVREKVNQNAQPNIGKDNIEKILLPIPPIQEQQAIVTTVNKLFAEVEQLEQLTKERINLKHDFAASALQRLVQAGDIKGEWAAVQQHFHTFFNDKPNVKKLRETILQLAVQGKLTTHWRKENPGVEPASELLKRIAMEKEQLIKNGKIKKENPLPPIKEEEIPFDLPEGWEWCRFQDIMVYGFTGLERSKNFQSIGYQYPYFKMNNIGDFGKCNWENLINVDANAVEVKKYSLKKNDFLFNTRNSYELVGKTCVIDYELENPVLFNNNIYKVEFGCNVNSNFINLMFNSPILKELLNFIKSATTNVAAIYQGKLSELLVVCPPIEEQYSIVATVNTLMGLCDKLEQEIGQQESQVEELMKSCLREVLDGNYSEGSGELGMAAEEGVGYGNE